jgi:hypothetical protein
MWFSADNTLASIGTQPVAHEERLQSEEIGDSVDIGTSDFSFVQSFLAIISKRAPCGTEPESPRVVVIELPAGAGPKPTQLGIPDRGSTNFSSLVSTLPARSRCCTRHQQLWRARPTVQTADKQIMRYRWEPRWQWRWGGPSRSTGRFCQPRRRRRPG